MPDFRIIVGDCIEGMRTLPAGSVHTCISSPPYWGLRDYGVEGQIGLEETPEQYVARMVEVYREVWRVLRDDGTCWVNLGDSYAQIGMGGNPAIKHKDLVGIPWMVAFALRQPYERVQIRDHRDRAWLAALIDGEGCITILQTSSPHGSGESYPPVLQVRMCDPECVTRAAIITGYGNASPRQDPPSNGGNRGSYQWRLSGRRAADIIAEVYPYLCIKRKQAIVAWNHQAVRDSYETKRGVTIPAAALEKQQYCRDLIRRINRREAVDLPSWMQEPSICIEPGWYLRSDVIWSKPNPMPESVTDRPTKAHEYVFLLTKQPRYFYDAEAVKETALTAEWPGIGPQHGGVRDRGEAYEPMAVHAGRNRRSVWHIATQPYAEAHFATYPEKLVEPMVLAGTSERGCCPECGAPWRRVTAKDRRPTRPGERTKVHGANSRVNVSRDPAHKHEWNGKVVGNRDPERHVTETRTVGWEPTCQHGREPVPCTVLDPFTGSGTTGVVACGHGRNFVGCELNPEYAAMARRRIGAVNPLLVREGA